MDVVALTRQLGAAVQQDERYAKFVAAKEASENDASVKEMMAKIDNLRTQYQAEAMNPDPDEMVLGKMDQDFQDLYTNLMMNETMQAYENARQELDAMMNYLMQILYLCVNGEDPATCEPQAEHDCGGECSHCSGC